VQDCQVCGRRFDPLGFQVVVPELARGFDRIECARSARTLGAAGALAVAPLIAVIEPIGAALVPATSSRALRPLASAPVAALGLFAAGTAAAAYLWVGVLGADSTRFTPVQSALARALGHETVQANVQAPRPSGERRPAPEAVVRLVSAVPVTAAPVLPSPTTARPHPSAHPPAKPPPAPVARPTAGSKETGRGHAKHGKGHLRHGEVGGVHTPGHGKSHGHGHGHKKHS
jgi:hypothetical protein